MQGAWGGWNEPCAWRPTLAAAATSASESDIRGGRKHLTGYSGCKGVTIAFPSGYRQL
jgi:hypothetical protein